MTAGAAVVLSILAAAVIVSALRKGGSKRPITGLITKDSKGRTAIVVWPAKRKGKRR